SDRGRHHNHRGSPPLALDLGERMTAMASMKDRMLAGELYLPADPELSRMRLLAQELLDSYNRTRPTEQDERERLLSELLGAVGKGVVINPPFRCDYGSQISIAEGSFVNYDCLMLDAAPIK